MRGARIIAHSGGTSSLVDVRCTQLPLATKPRFAASSARSGVPFAASVNEYRGITNVWQVVRRIEAAIALPGGIYNFGSPNRCSTHDTVLEAARFLAAAGHLEAGSASPVNAVEAPQRNLAMNLHCIEQFGLTFPDTISGLKAALLHGA